MSEPMSNHREVIARALSGLSLATWRAADKDPTMRSPMIGLLVMDAAPDWAALVLRFDRASRTVPILRQRIVKAPGDVGAPRVIVDPNFDLSLHMSRFELRKGAGWSDVMDEVRHQSIADFDLDRPLWKVTVLEGLPGGRSALIMKLHHSMADGKGTVDLFGALIDFSAEIPDLGPMPEEPAATVTTASELAQAVVLEDLSTTTARVKSLAAAAGPAASAAFRDPAEAIDKVAKFATSAAHFTDVPSEPLSPLMLGRSHNYHVATFDVDFSTLRAAAKLAGHSVNDAFLCSVVLGLVDYHRQFARPVDALRINVPVSIASHTEGETSTVALVRLDLPLTDLEPKVLMESISTAVRQWRSEPALAYYDEMAQATNLLPASVISKAARASDATASNVGGMPVPIWISGAKVERIYPVVATVGAAINVTMMTYENIGSIGVSMDDAAIDDQNRMMACLAFGFSSVTGTAMPSRDPFAG